MKAFLISIKMILIMTVLTGILYPLLITLIAQLLFPKQANGSLIEDKGKVIGSSLIGQQFSSNKHFASRPSAVNYNTLPSGATNYGLTSKKLDSLFKRNEAEFKKLNQLSEKAKVPSEMLFASASGLDPHISKEAAILQIDRIAKERGFNAFEKDKLKELIIKHTEEPQFLIFGERRVNVLLLNLDLEKIKNK